MGGTALLQLSQFADDATRRRYAADARQRRRQWYIDVVRIVAAVVKQHFSRIVHGGCCFRAVE